MSDKDGRRVLASAALGALLVAIRNRWRSAGQPRTGHQPAEAGGDRGRAAESPSEIPARGWRDIALRVKDEISTDNLSAIAAGVAFYALFAIVPALGALVSIYGLFADPLDVEEQIAAIAGILPGEALEIIKDQLHRAAAGAETKLGFAAFFGIALALWSATKGVSALFTALNVAYDEEEERGFIKLNLVTLAFTAGGVLFVLLAIALVVGVPAVTEALGLWGPIAWVVSIARWPVLAILLVVAMALVYRYGPSRDEAKWRWISPGAVFATVVWVIGSIGFSWYVSNFGGYDKTYGSLGAVAILMMWFWLSAYIVLIGAELNAEMEHQTAKDTTKGTPQPLGTRRAYVADTVGESR